ncbi:hypothetical protein PFISCL1PPCAC_495, partial [Pristionchus fissidentatus]
MATVSIDRVEGRSSSPSGTGEAGELIGLSVCVENVGEIAALREAGVDQAARPLGRHVSVVHRQVIGRSIWAQTLELQSPRHGGEGKCAGDDEQGDDRVERWHT